MVFGLFGRKKPAVVVVKPTKKKLGRPSKEEAAERRKQRALDMEAAIKLRKLEKELARLDEPEHGSVLDDLRLSDLEGLGKKLKPLGFEIRPVTKGGSGDSSSNMLVQLADTELGRALGERLAGAVAPLAGPIVEHVAEQQRAAGTGGQLPQAQPQQEPARPQQAPAPQGDPAIRERAEAETAQLIALIEPPGKERISPQEGAAGLIRAANMPEVVFPAARRVKVIVTDLQKTQPSRQGIGEFLERQDRTNPHYRPLWLWFAGDQGRFDWLVELTGMLQARTPQPAQPAEGI